MESTQLIGKAKELEIAGQFTRHGLLVFSPFVDTGADLVVSDQSMRRFLPIQVKYRARNPGIGLEQGYVERLMGINLILVFIIGKGNNSGTWYIPLSDFSKKAKKPPNRKDNRMYITVNDNLRWLEKYKGDNGVLRIKQRLAT